MKPRFKRSTTVTEGARAILPKLAANYFKAGRKASGRKRSTKALHRFRIATKRFRYSLELFRPLYGANLERRLKALRELQQSLGKMSDYRTIMHLVGDDAALQARLEKAIQRQLKEFRRRWKEFDSGGQLKKWKSYLAAAPPRSSREVRH